MKVDNLDNQLCKTVFIRKNGQIKAVKIPLNAKPSLAQHPMFPIERPTTDGTE